MVITRLQPINPDWWYADGSARLPNYATCGIGKHAAR